VAAIAPVAVRRIWPVPVLAVVTGVCCALTAHGRVPNLVYVALGMAIYTAAVQSRRKAALAMLVVVEVALGAAMLTAATNSRTQSDVARGLLVAGALWFIGDSVRERRRYLAGLAAQAAQRQWAEAERGRQAVREERVRIARELHDVVAHSLSVVTVQAGVGRKIEAARPGEALRALRAVEVTGRGALEELRRILGLLRDDEPEAPSLAPVPGIEDLEDLADSVRAAGIPVGLAVTGDAAGLPPAAALTVYRIVQEALTNVVKHASRAEASVRVRAGPDGVRITVTDSGSGGPAAAAASRAGVAGGAAGQHGIVGMRERAAAFGGTLDAAALPGSGFRVRAFLPVSGLTVGQVA
jgi:signal transduction histidine kinase